MLTEYIGGSLGIGLSKEALEILDHDVDRD